MVAQSDKDTVGIEFPSLVLTCYSRFGAHRPGHVLVTPLSIISLSRIIDEFVNSRVVAVADVLVLG